MLKSGNNNNPSMARPQMRVFAPIAFSLSLLGACAETVIAPVPAPPAPASVAGVSGAEVGRLDPRAAVQMFVDVTTSFEPVAERECRARAPQLNCDFRIVVDDTPGMPPNAFQTLDPSGRPILVFTLAMLGEVQNADELAFVMSHEVSHHIAGHLARQRQNSDLGAAVFGELAGITGQSSAEQIRVAQQLGAAVGARSYSKEFELEADALGTIIAHNAGYDPVKGAQFFFRIPDPGDRFLGTHPANAARIAVVQRVAAGL